MQSCCDKLIDVELRPVGPGFLLLTWACHGHSYGPVLSQNCPKCVMVRFF